MIINKTTMIKVDERIKGKQEIQGLYFFLVDVGGLWREFC